MNELLEEICGYLRNWFIVPGGIHRDNYVISDGKLALPFLAKNQYYRILGSVFNDGIHKYGLLSDVLIDESFDGTIQALAIPTAVISIADEIREWNTKNADTINSPYQSESFGGYTYTKASDGASEGGLSWKSVFAARLARWRKI